MADSLSMVLDTPTVHITVSPSETFQSQSFDAQEKEVPQSEKSIARLEKHWHLVRTYLQSIGRLGDVPTNVSLHIHSAIPPAIGIASSAAIFSCLAEAYAGLVHGVPLTRSDVSILGRLGSGSGARCCFGGFVTLENTRGDDIASTQSRQIANETHWPLHDIIIVQSHKEKKVGSTEGHAMAHTSPLYADRIRAIPRRMKECIDAITMKDFEKLQRVAEEDSLDMHRVMETQVPSLQYLSSDTHRILREIEALRKSEHIEVLYTMDAGPTVHLLCSENALGVVKEFARSQKGCSMFETKIGGPSRLLS